MRIQVVAMDEAELAAPRPRRGGVAREQGSLAELALRGALGRREEEEFPAGALEPGELVPQLRRERAARAVRRDDDRRRDRRGVEVRTQRLANPLPEGEAERELVELRQRRLVALTLARLHVRDDPFHREIVGLRVARQRGTAEHR